MTNYFRLTMTAFLLLFVCYNNTFAVGSQALGTNEIPTEVLDNAVEDCFEILMMEGRTSTTTVNLNGIALKIKVYDSSGQVVFTDSNPGSPASVDLSGYAIDTYEIEVLTTEGTQIFYFENN